MEATTGPERRPYSHAKQLKKMNKVKPKSKWFHKTTYV